MPGAQADLVRERRIDERDRRSGGEHDVSDAARNGSGGAGAEQTGVEELAAGGDPGKTADGVARRAHQLCAFALPRVQVAEASVSRHRGGVRHEIRNFDPAVPLEMHLPVIRRDDQRRLEWQRRPQLVDHPVDERELASVELILQPELVGDRVDTGIVRIDESLASCDGLHARASRAMRCLSMRCEAAAAFK